MRLWSSRFLHVILAAAAIAAANLPAHAATQFDVLHAFCKTISCGDGEFAMQSMVMDQAGNLYGTAQGGAHGEGIVYELTPPVTGSKWTYNVLYHFCALQNCTDGRDPSGSTLIVDTAGNVYGTTIGGGLGNDTGTVFRLSPPIKGKLWRLQTIYNFCFAFSSCKDGNNPSGGLTYAGREAGLAYDGTSPLYGTAAGGGGRFGGVAYTLTPAPNGKWSEQVLYGFCRLGGHNCTDGDGPIQRLTMDAAGNLYGTTSKGGAHATGVAFKLSPQSGLKLWSETVLDDFCANCIVQSGLAIDQSGNLFGSSWTTGGGANCEDTEGCGFIFEIDAGGTVSTVYGFCSQPGCADGDGPIDQGGLLVDNAGNIFGTTRVGGAHDDGTIFELSGGAVQVLHDLCSEKNCDDGALSFAGLIADSSGNLYGTSLRGGAHGDGGAVFEVTP
jgi:uncharacterized repeat protein (TIGR03803 family)